MKDRCERTRIHQARQGHAGKRTEDIVKANLAWLLRGAEASAEQRAETFFLQTAQYGKDVRRHHRAEALMSKKTPLVGRTEVSEDV